MPATLDTLLISTEEVKALTPVSPNISLTNRIEASIHAAQRSSLRVILGQSLYEEIIAQAATNTLTPENLALVNQAKTMMAYYAALKFLPYLNYQVRDAGVVGLQGTNYERTDNGYKEISKSLSETATTEQSLFERWLCENAADYPLWCDTTYWHELLNRGWLDLSVYPTGYDRGYSTKRSTLGIFTVGSEKGRRWGT